MAYDASDLCALTASTGVSGAIPAAPTIGVLTLDGGLKRAQELVARALADSWNTRTWDLMIDVIAQTGRFPKTSSVGALDQFAVNGERRIWAHVAIDRFTGKVISLKIEPVDQ